MKTSSVSNSANQQVDNFFADKANLDSPSKSSQQFSKSVSCKQIVLAILYCKQIHLQTPAA
jgi:hypothetical protein